MPRNGSGVMSVVNTFTPLTTADANAVNANFTDFASEVTGSLPRNGEAPMTGQFQAISGTVANPGMAFSSDTNTGIRRSGADAFRLVCGGVDIAEISAGGIELLSGDLTAGNTVPSGIIAPYGGTTAPTGWLKCNGAAVSRTTYADLFAAIGTTWGAGNGTTTFNVPDFRSRFPRGADDGLGYDAALIVGLTQADELKSHTHTGTTETDGIHQHPSPTGGTGGGNAAQTAPRTGAGITTDPSGAHDHDFTTDATGGSETRPRSVVSLFIIKT